MITHSYFMRIILFLLFICFSSPSWANDPLSVYKSEKPRAVAVEKAKPKVNRSNMLKYQILAPTRFNHHQITKIIENPPLPAHKPLQPSEETAPSKTVRRNIPKSTMSVDTINLERDLKNMDAEQVLDSISNRTIE